MSGLTVGGRVPCRNMDKPALVTNDVRSGVQRGGVALAVLTGAAYLSNFEVRAAPSADSR